MPGASSLHTILCHPARINFQEILYAFKKTCGCPPVKSRGQQSSRCRADMPHQLGCRLFLQAAFTRMSGVNIRPLDYDLYPCQSTRTHYEHESPRSQDRRSEDLRTYRELLEAREEYSDGTAVSYPCRGG
jgi:hypothetical protein